MLKYVIGGTLLTALLLGIYVMAAQKTQNNSPQLVTLPSGLQYQLLKDSAGAQAKKGNTVTVHYTGWLYDVSKPERKGTKFDSSLDRKQPFQFTLGSGMVIKGWDEGVSLMKVGEKRRFIIPGILGYGSRGYPGVIPPNATLVFDVELLKIG